MRHKFYIVRRKGLRGEEMTKKELIKKIEEAKEILEMAKEDYAQKYEIETQEVYAYRTGHVIAMLEFILAEA